MATQPSLSLNDQLLAVVPPRKWPHNFLFLKKIKCCAILRNSQVFSCAIMKMASKLSFSQNNQLLRNIAQFSSFHSLREDLLSSHAKLITPHKEVNQPED